MTITERVETPDVTPDQRGRRPRLIGINGPSLERIALPMTFLFVIVLFSVLRPQTFPTSANVSSILSSQAVLVVLTLGILGPLIVGDLDISAAAVAGLSAMLVVILTANHHMNFVLAVVISLGCACLIGLVNGILAAVMGLDTLIVTLGTGSLATGITAWISNNNTITGLAPTLVKIVVTDQLWGVSVEFYYGLALCLIVFYLLRYTPLGRRMLIVGQAREVARLSGINVNRVRIGSLVFCSAMAGLAGILYAGTSGAASATGGAELLLPAYAAAFLGATTITPGRFNAFGALIAVYFLATGITGLQLLGAQNYVQQIFYGVALLLAVTVSSVIRRTPKPAGP
ncbi:MAG: ribose transport system permease protein [Pseudonocardiales bacterium]|jgi:ribose transport system permease protein|nr:ABC-type transporter, integral rane subunit [Pseudonocardiales bacterium]MDT4980020.1 ribose transport system permease protein [Pseudonocardiales bacterium]